MKSSLVAFSALLLATAAQAQSDAPAGGNATATTPTNQGDNSPAARRRAREERQICRNVEDTGSRLPQRVCLTARQWRDYGDR